MQHRASSHVTGLPRGCLQETHNKAYTYHQSCNLGLGRRQLALRPEMMPCALPVAGNRVEGLITTWQAAEQLTSAAYESLPLAELSCKTDQDQDPQKGLAICDGIVCAHARD